MPPSAEHYAHEIQRYLEENFDTIRRSRTVDGFTEEAYPSRVGYFLVVETLGGKRIGYRFSAEAGDSENRKKCLRFILLSLRHLIALSPKPCCEQPQPVYVFDPLESHWKMPL